MGLDIAAELQRLVDEEGARQYAAGAASRQAEVDQLTAAIRNLLQDKQTLSDLVTKVRGERDAAIAELAAHMATHAPPPVDPPPAPEPEPTPEPPPVHRVLMGMSTDQWDARVADTGPVSAHRIFVPRFDIDQLVAKLRESNARGVTPYWSMKFNTTWAAADDGTDDGRFAALGRALAGLDFDTYGSLHHEPRDSNVKTPQQLIPWSRATTRAFNIIRPIAGPRHMLGTTDNGFPWGVRAQGQALTDAELAIYYTPQLLEACDFLGGDFYDGRTDTNPGEPAAVKMAKFEAWAQRIGFDGPLAVGEWNAVTAADIAAGWEVLREGPWAIACLFNSSNNNRPDLPTDGSLGNPPSWVLRGDRLAAFRRVLAAARA